MIGEVFKSLMSTFAIQMLRCGFRLGLFSLLCLKDKQMEGHYVQQVKNYKQQYTNRLVLAADAHHKYHVDVVGRKKFSKAYFFYASFC